MKSTPKLFGLLFFFFFCCKGCISTNLSRPSSGLMASPGENDGGSTNSGCYVPYHLVGEYCLLITNDIRGTWNEVRDVCHDFGGELVNLQDANTLYEISQYIKSNEMDDVSYWVGATDEAAEGKWVWNTGNNSSVKGGAPLWGHLYEQQPDGGEDQNCAALYVKDYHYMHDDVCDGMHYGFICQPPASEELMPSDEVENDNTFNVPPNECPSPYEMIGNACLQIFPGQNFTWTAATDLCDGPSSHLAKIDDANLLGSIYDYLIERENITSLWIGGTDYSTTDNWLWQDGTPIKLGTPFWEVFSEELQLPVRVHNFTCTALSSMHSWYFGNMDCTHPTGVICQYDMW